MYLSKVTETSESEQAGKFTRDELKKDAKLAWTDKTKAEIAAAKGETPSNGTTNGGNSGQSGNTGGSGNNGNTGTVTPSNGDNTGGGDTGGGDNNGGGDTPGGDPGDVN